MFTQTHFSRSEVGENDDAIFVVPAEHHEKGSFEETVFHLVLVERNPDVRHQ